MAAASVSQLVDELSRRISGLEWELDRSRQRDREGLLWALVGEGRAIRRAREEALLAAQDGSAVMVMGEVGSGRTALAAHVHRHREAPGPLWMVRPPCDVAVLERVWELLSEGTLLVCDLDRFSSQGQAWVARQASVAPGPKLLAATWGRSSDPDGPLAEAPLFRRLRMPPLGERLEDLRPLTEALLARLAGREGVPPPRFDDEMESYLRRWDFRGQLCALRAWVEVLWHGRLTDSEGGGTLRAAVCLGSGPWPGRDQGDLRSQVERFEQSVIGDVLRAEKGNKTRTAEVLGITREGLHKKLAKHRF